MNRRNFLKKSIGGVGSAILATHSLEVFLGNVLTSLFQKAYAQSIGIDETFLEKKLISLNLASAPPRWLWDLPLKPNGEGDPFSYGTARKNSMLITKLNKNSEGIAGYLGEYALAKNKIGNFYLPYLWESKIATPNNNSAKMSELAQNMIMIRGIKTIDSHFGSRDMMLRPTGGPSIGGLIADESKSPIPSFLTTLSSMSSYKSKKGISGLMMTGGDPFSSALSPFNKSDKLITVDSKDTTIDAIENALEIMRTKSGDHHRMLPTTYEERIKAKKMMLKSYNNLKDVYTTLVNKYENLISRSFGDTSLRLEDCDNLDLIGDSQYKHFRLHKDTDDRFLTGKLSEVINTKHTIDFLAAGFAISEFMILGKDNASNDFQKSFSAAANITHGGYFKLNNDNLYAIDAHFVGSYTTLVLFSRYFRAVSSCLYELKSQLQQKQTEGKNLFDQTVITITSEFSRRANDDASGSEHGSDGACYSILSGMVPELMVFGDIYSNPEKQKGYNNTWGHGAPMQNFRNQETAIGNAVTTVTTLLGVETPSTNNPSFVRLDSKTGQAKGQYPTAKNVAWKKV